MKKKYFTFLGLMLGCLFIFSQANSQITVTSVITDITCNGDSNGAINITPLGGSGSYIFDWSNGASTQNVTGLAAGAYTVTVTEDLSGPFSWSFTNTGANHTIMITDTVVLEIDGISPAAGDYIGAFYNLSGGGMACGGYIPFSGSPTALSAWGAQSGMNDGFASSEELKFKYYRASTGLVIDLTAAFELGFPNSNTYATGGMSVLDSLMGTSPVAAFAIHSATVGDPGAINPNGTVTNVSASGGSNGAIDLSVLGGTPAYTFNWGAGITSEDRTGLTAATYMVTVTDAHFCTGSASYTVTEPTAVTLSTVVADVTCFGGNNGGIDLTVSGGTTPYTIVWDGSVSAEDLSGLAAGSHNVVVTDAGGFVASGSYTVNQAPQITLSAITTDVTCNGGTNGAVEVTVTNGVATISYAWSNSATTEDLSNVGAGTYTLNLTDGSGCTASGSWTLSEPTALSKTFAVNNVSTFGASDGSIILTVDGGTTPYSFSWSNSATTKDISGLAAGFYQVTISDANACTITGEAEVSDAPPASFLVTGVKADVSCNGLCDGSIDVSVSGGILPYSYIWSQGGNTQDVSGLCAGTYTVTVSDATGSSVPTFNWTFATTDFNHSIIIPTTGITIDGQAPVAGDYFGVFYNTPGGLACGGYQMYPASGVTSVAAWGTESGMNNGFAPGEVFKWKYFRVADGAEITLGNATYSPPIPFAGIVNDSTYSPNGGSMILTLSGISSPPASAQTEVLSFTITEPTAIVISGIPSQVMCNGGSDGAVDITISGGSAPYTYLWSSGQIVDDISGLTAGDYTVTVTDASFCTAQMTFTVTEPDALIITGDVTFVSCNGLSDGAVDATITGGTSPFTFAWSNLAATEDISGLSADTYTLTVTDSQGCVATNSYVVEEPTMLTAAATPTNLLCYNDNTGAIDLTVTGGTLPYGYLWSNSSMDEDLSGIAAGTYDVTVTDANGCIANASTTVTEPAEFSASGVATDVDCYGAATGSVDLTVVGGTAPVVFAWSNSYMGEDLMTVVAGTYSVVVTDDNNCSLNFSYTINEPAELVIAATISNVSCNGLSDGAIDVAVSGGTAPYAYSWLGGSALEDIDNLAAGTYMLTVTDANGCMKDASFTVTQPIVLTSTGTATDLLCNGDGNGSVDLMVDGGTMPYIYSWSNSSTDEDLAGLSGGTFDVTITDSNGCIATNSFSVFEPTTLVVSGTTSDVLCYGGSEGAVNLSVSGGTPTYTFLWSNGAMTEDVSGLTAGNYSVTVMDANACQVIMPFTINEPGDLTINSSEVNLLCNGDNDGSINLSIMGGTAPFAYTWSNSATTKDLSGLSAGVYNITVVDAHSCMTSASITISQPAALSLASVITNVSILWGSDGAIDITIGGGILPYSFAWSNLAVSEDLTFINAGNYTVTISDDNNCTLVHSFTINQPPDNPGWTFTNTGINHTILIPDYATLVVEGSPLIPGDFIGVFYDSLGTPACGGFIQYTGVTQALTAWGAQSGLNDGFADGEQFTWMVWKALQNTEYAVNAIYMPIGPLQITHQELFAAQGMSGITALEDVEARQYIELAQGWSMISSYVVAPQMNLDSIFFDIVSNVGLMKDDMGSSYWPFFGVNQIGNWVSEEGYKLYMTGIDTLVIAGDNVDPLLTPINLPYGWSMMGYLLSTPANPIGIFSPINGLFDMVKDGNGQVYWPMFGFNSMGNMMPDKGYAIYTNTATSLYFPVGPTNVAKTYNKEIDSKQYGKPANTGANMIVGIPLQAWETLPAVGDEVAVFNASGQLVGSGVFANTVMAIAVWGDNDQTSSKDGLLENETFELRIYNQADKSEQTLFVNWSQGSANYVTDEIAIAGKISMIESFSTSLGQNMPNPASSVTEIEYNLGNDANVEISIFNILGSKIEVLVSKSQLAGTYKVQFDTRNLPAGTYFYKLRTDDFEAVKKMNVVR